MGRTEDTVVPETADYPRLGDLGVMFLFIFLAAPLILWALSFPAAAKSLQSCPTPCDPIDGSPLLEIKLVPPAMETSSLNHQATREVLSFSFVYRDLV